MTAIASELTSQSPDSDLRSLDIGTTLAEVVEIVLAEYLQDGDELVQHVRVIQP